MSSEQPPLFPLEDDEPTLVTADLVRWELSKLFDDPEWQKEPKALPTTPEEADAERATFEATRTHWCTPSDDFWSAIRELRRKHDIALESSGYWGHLVFREEQICMGLNPMITVNEQLSTAIHEFAHFFLLGDEIPKHIDECCALAVERIVARILGINLIDDHVLQSIRDKQEVTREELLEQRYLIERTAMTIVNEFRGFGIRVAGDYLPKFVEIDTQRRMLPLPKRVGERLYCSPEYLAFNIAYITDYAHALDARDLGIGLRLEAEPVDDPSLIQALGPYNCGYVEPVGELPLITHLYLRGDDRQLYRILAHALDGTKLDDDSQSAVFNELLCAAQRVTPALNQQRVIDGTNVLWGCLIASFGGWFYGMPESSWAKHEKLWDCVE